MTKHEKKQSLAALRRAIQMFGSQGALARKLNVTRQMISYMVRGTVKCPPKMARRIEEATEGHVRREELRPDVFA